MNPPRVLHPFFVALFPPLFLLAQNTGHFEWTVVLRPAGMTLAGAGLLLALLRLPVRDWHRAGVLVSLGVLLAFSYGHLFALVESAGWVPPGYWLNLDAGLAGLLGLLFMWALYRLSRPGRDLSHWTGSLNAFGACLVVASGVTVLHGEYSQGRRLLTLAAPARMEASGMPAAGAAPERARNIFYIVADGYSRSDNLKRLYGHDNTPFLAALRARGFYVAEASRSNYAFTRASLPSALEMDYLPWGESTRTPNSHFKVATFLRGLGYRFVALATGYSPTEFREADLFLAPPGHHSQFEQALLGSLPLMGDADRAEADRRRVLFAFDQLPKLAATPGPLFVFAHIISPHPPYVFDARGRPSEQRKDFGITAAGALLSPRGFTRAQSAKHYVEQVRFMNAQLEATIDAILKASRVPPIIVVQSDHGHLDYFDVRRAPDNTYLHDRFSILNAYYLPERSAKQCVWGSITPVNSFRAIFNCYFDAKLERLPERQFVSREQAINEYVEVSERIDSAEDRANYERLRARDYFH